MLRTKLIVVLSAALVVLGSTSARADSPDRSVVKVQTGTGTNNTWTCPATVSVVEIPVKNVSAAPVTVSVADGNGANSVNNATWSYSTPQFPLAADATHTILVTITATGVARPTGNLVVSFSVPGKANTGDDWHIHMECPEPKTGTADVSAPTLSWTFTGATGANGWYIGGGALIVTCNDGGADYAGSGGGLLADGTHTRVLTCTDGVNTTMQTVMIRIDSVAPTLSRRVTSGAAGNDGWYRSSVGLAFPCTDSGSGVSSAPADQTISAQGTTSVAVTCTDVAGNTGTHSSTIQIDSVVPTVTWTGDRTYDVDENVMVQCLAADAGSGIASSDCGVEATGVAYTLGLGTHDLTASAADVAGNETLSSTTYSVVPTAEGTCRLIPLLVTNQGVANSLCVKIRNSQAAVARGQAKTELNVLDAFDQEVRAQANRKIVAGGDTVLLAISAWLRSH